jgi:ribA/ribD-fused uncharacterized protein
MDGDPYPTIEHAYQAAKTLDPTWRLAIANAASPHQAKVLGRVIDKRPDLKRLDWFNIDLDVMYHLLQQKFGDKHYFGRMLLNTGYADLVERNHWHDCFWGVCTCSAHYGKGENHLGILLMIVRAEIRQLDPSHSRVV